MARGDPQINLRIPASLKDWLEDRATRNFRSMTNEAVAILSEKRSQETETAGSAS